MSPTSHVQSAVGRRDGATTRTRASRIALRLFTEQGYEGTSLRQIADELGINKASLYYYFPSKEAILQSLVDERGSEAQELVDWLRQQPRTPRLLRTAVLRWVGSFSSEKLQGIRFMAANPRLDQILSAPGSDRIGSSLNDLADELTALVPGATEEDSLLLRMAILSINAAVHAAVRTHATDEEIIAAAQRAARALVAAVSPR